MRYKTITTTLLSIAAAHAEGFTVDALTLQPVTSGYAVALAATQDSFGLEGLERVIDFVKSNAGVTAFGGWLDEESGQFYWDATVVVEDRETAEKLARENGQIAFFNLDTLEVVRLLNVESLPLAA